MLKEKSISDSIIETSLCDETTPSKAPGVYCARCRQQLADTSSIFSLAGQPTHNAFANPAGFLRVVITFESVRNYTEEGHVTKDFTWFAGYSWQVIYCQSCKSHLGWKYHSNTQGTPNLFYGLLQTAILVDE
ncbi:MAG: cereblon family protein [Myxococcota bacterium]|nr:cereblon family protein [Myxococcota bacterium]